jgi:transcriptional regulator with XRE-family HTH domain
MSITRLRLWRTSQGWSQNFTAEKLGMSRALYGPIESGRMTPTPHVAARLKEFFGEDASELLKPIKTRDGVPVLREAAAQQ